MSARDKVLFLDDLEMVIESLRAEKRCIVFTNGCFDLLHIGHLRYLEAARNLGDCLLVGMNSDASVRRVKGHQRPIMPEKERAELLCGLHCVDHVVLFDTPDPLPLIEKVKPDVLVKGADWTLEKIVGADYIRDRGGKVVRIPLVPRVSTTSIIEKILERFAGPRSRLQKRSDG